MAENDLLTALVKQAKGHRDRVPVFRIAQTSAEESMTQARALAIQVWPQFGDCSFRPENVGTLVTQMRLSEDGRVNL